MNAPIDLNLARAFVAVCETESFSQAGARLGVPRSTVSRSVAALEEALGLRLFQRTTRNVSVTASGNALYERVAPSLTTLEGSFSGLPEQEEQPSGLLRISTTADMGSAFLAEAVTRFTQRYPRVQVELHLTNRVVSLVAEKFDLALRTTRSTLRDSTLVARKVGVLELRIYAAPSYIARRGMPRNPADLASHDWVALRGTEKLLLTAPGRRFKLESNPRIVADDMTYTREALRMGAGVGVAASFFCEPDVVAGSLVRVVPKWTAFTGSVYLVQPTRKHVPRRVSAFTEILLELFRRSPLSSR